MIEEIFTGLVISAFGGLTFLAYKYPALYRQVYSKFVVLVLGGGFGMNFSNFTNPYYELSAMLNTFKDTGSQEAMSLSLEKLSEIVHDLKSFALYLGVIFLIWLYFYLLIYLRHLINYYSDEKA